MNLLANETYPLLNQRTSVGRTAITVNHSVSLRCGATLVVFRVVETVSGQ